MTPAEVLVRAASATKLPIRYRLGAGGMSPSSTTPADSSGACDCSGFVCWALGISRRTSHPAYEYQGGWINTDSMARDIKKTGGLFTQCEPKVGCVVVFPGPPARSVGHCGVVVQVKPLRVAHCSASNARGGRGAVLVTDGSIFQTRDAVYGWLVAMRPDDAPATSPAIIESITAVGRPPTLDAALVHDQAITLRPLAPVSWWARLRLWLP